MLSKIRKLISLLLLVIIVLNYLLVGDFSLENIKESISPDEVKAQTNPSTFDFSKIVETPGFSSSSLEVGINSFHEIGGDVYGFGAGKFWLFNNITNTWSIAGHLQDNPSLNCSGANFRAMQTKQLQSFIVLAYSMDYCGDSFQIRLVEVYTKNANKTISRLMQYNLPNNPSGAGGAASFEMTVHNNSMFILMESQPSMVFQLPLPLPAPIPASGLPIVCNGNIANSRCGDIVGFYETPATDSSRLIGIVNFAGVRVAEITFSGGKATFNINILPGNQQTPILSWNPDASILDTVAVGNIRAAAFFSFECSNFNGANLEIAFIRLVNVEPVEGGFYNVSVYTFSTPGENESVFTGKYCSGSGSSITYAEVLNGGKYLVFNRNGVDYNFFGYTRCNANINTLPAGNRYLRCANNGSGDRLRQFSPFVSHIGRGGIVPGLPSFLRVTNMFYSPTYDRVFFALKNSSSTGLTTANFAPDGGKTGIWSFSFASQIPNACTSMSASVSTLTFSQRTSTITVRGTSGVGLTNTSGRITFLDPNGNNILQVSSPTVSRTIDGNGNYTFTYTIPDYTTIGFDRYPNVRVRVEVPGLTGFAPPPCQLTLTIGQQSTNPSVVGIPVITCDSNQQLNPYRLRFRIQAAPSNIPGASVNRITAVLQDRNTSPTWQAFSSVNGTATDVGTKQNAFVTTVGPIGTGASVVKNPSSGGSFVTSEFVYTTVAGTNPLAYEFSFTIEFDRSLNLYETYYGSNNSSSFRLNIFVSDTSGRNNLDAQGRSSFTQEIAISNPFDQCAALYYQTANGDVRSNEAASIAVVPSNTSKRHDRIIRLSGASLGVDGQAAMAANTKVNDYLYQTSGTSPCSSNPASTPFTRVNNADFCQVSGVQSRLSANVEELNASLISLEQSGRARMIPVNTGNTISLQAYANNSSFDPNRINIFKINRVASSNVITIDDNWRSAIATQTIIIFWCPNGCDMRVRRVGSIADSAGTASVNTQNGNFNFTAPSGPAGFRSFAEFRTTEAALPSRVYFNRNASQGMSCPFCGITLLNPAVDPNQLLTTYNYFNGAFITDGYFQTSRSTKTDMVNGLVVARGIRTSFKTAGSTTNLNTNGNIDFRDFYDPVSNRPIPFLYIYYDPKYLYTLGDIVTIAPESVPRSVVGL
jgi:hypothetical protein